MTHEDFVEADIPDKDAPMPQVTVEMLRKM
jgi:hypothetical protein